MEDMTMRYYVKEINGTFVSLALDDNNNYSIASDGDPTPDGYTNHQWGADAAEWHEVDAAAIRRLGHANYLSVLDGGYDNETRTNYRISGQPDGVHKQTPAQTSQHTQTEK